MKKVLIVLIMLGFAGLVSAATGWQWYAPVANGAFSNFQSGDLTQKHLGMFKMQDGNTICYVVYSDQTATASVPLPPSVSMQCNIK